MYGASIGIKPQNTTLLITQIQRGFPVRTFTKLKSNLDVAENELAGILNIPISTLARRKKGKRFPFEESERIFRIARLFDRAVEVFETEEMARRWLKTPVWGLGDATPLEYSATELGAMEVDNLLGRIEDGVYP